MIKLIRKVEGIVLTVLGCAMTIIMFVNASGRYLAGQTFLWAEETIRICFVWAMFIAITDLFISHGHIGFDVVANKNKITKMISILVTNLVLIGLGGNLVFFGLKIVGTVGQVPLAATKLPNAIFSFPGILAGAVWVLIGIKDIAQLFFGKNEEKQVEKTDAAEWEGGVEE